MEGGGGRLDLGVSTPDWTAERRRRKIGGGGGGGGGSVATAAVRGKGEGSTGNWMEGPVAQVLAPSRLHSRYTVHLTALSKVLALGYFVCWRRRKVKRRKRGGEGRGGGNEGKGRGRRGRGGGKEVHQ